MSYFKAINIITRRYLDLIFNKKRNVDLSIEVSYEKGFKDQIALFMQKGFVFIHVPKSAGSAVFSFFYGHNSAGHFSANLLKEVIGKQEWKKLFKFSFIRNPYTRTYSAFSYLKKGGYGSKDLYYKQLLEPYTDFQSFILNDGLTMALNKNIVHFTSQYRLILGPKDEMLLDFIGKYENLQEDLKIICKTLDIEFENLPWTNKTFVNDNELELRNIYTNEMIDRVYCFYKKDFKLFGYSENF